MARTLAHVCELSTASNAAPWPTLDPVTDPACMQLTESMSLSCIRSQPPPNVRTTTRRPRGTHKRRTPLQPPPLARPALAAHCDSAPGPSKAARERSVDWIASRVSATAQTIAGSSWWVSAFERGLQVDLEHSTPTSSTNSPIVMVAPTPSRRDHLLLMRRPRMQPCAQFGSCSSAQWAIGLHSVEGKCAQNSTMERDSTYHGPGR